MTLGKKPPELPLPPYDSDEKFVKAMQTWVRIALNARKSLLEAAEELENIYHQPFGTGSNVVKLIKKLRISAGVE